MTQIPYITLLILISQIHSYYSLNSEGLALLEFRAKITCDPRKALAYWNPHDSDPCLWSGIHCVDGEVQILDLSGNSLEGILAPELGNLIYLRFLILSNNHLSGVIPKQFGQLSVLEVLDLRDNNLFGTVPAEIGGLQMLKRLLLSNNNFEGRVPFAITKLNQLIELEYDENLSSTAAEEVGYINRKVGQSEWQTNLRALKRADFLSTTIKETVYRYFSLFPIFAKESFRFGSHNSCDHLQSSTEPHTVQTVQKLVEVARRKLAEQSTNLEAVPANGSVSLDNVVYHPTRRSSGSFPAVPTKKNELSSPPAPLPPHLQQRPPSTPHPDEHSGAFGQAADKQDVPVTSGGNTWKYIVGISTGGFLIFAVFAFIFFCRSRAAETIVPWKTGLSGQLQKAFVTGVPKLNRAELETACEDFSNITHMLDEVTIYKGTLSSGVEIAVASTTVASLAEWSESAEKAFRKKIDTLSRVNHKNFVNLIGYCEEDEPFSRMMVFEYAPNGTLFEHLHVKEVEHLDWSARMRIIMGTAYCLDYMHDLKPPVAHSNLTSKNVFLTDDYAAKIIEFAFWAECYKKSKVPGEKESEHSELPPTKDPETNVYSFGLVLLEVISGKLVYSEDCGDLLNWASQYLSEKTKHSHLIDPTLKSFKNNELEIICEVIQQCVHPDSRKRPTMKEVIAQLRPVLDISPESATPRLSPLWWAELEILSAEAA